MLVPSLSSSVWLLSNQVTTKPPLARPVITGASWSSVVSVLTRNSDPTLLPSATCALMPVPQASPSVPLVSSQVTTKPPLASPVTVGASWLPVVLVFTEVRSRHDNGSGHSSGSLSFKLCRPADVVHWPTAKGYESARARP